MGGRGKGGGDRKMTYKEKSSIKFVAQDEPDFLKKMKAELGYKAPATVEDKFEDVEQDDHKEEDDLGEDGPMVVVLDPTKDMSKEEVDKELAEKKKIDDDKLIAEGKIVFRKPAKRTQEGSSKDVEPTEEKKKRKDDEPKEKINKSLLSFGDDDDDDE